MIRKSFVMQLNHGAEEEYRRRHNPIWEELEQILHAHGVHNYSIFLHPETKQLFAYAEIEDEAQLERHCGDAGLPSLVELYGRPDGGKSRQFPARDRAKVKCST